MGQLGQRLEQKVEVARAEADAEIVNYETLKVGSVDDEAAVDVDGGSAVFVVYVVTLSALIFHKC